MSYQLVRSFYDGEEIIDTESKLESASKEAVSKALEDGNIVKREASEGEAPLAPEDPRRNGIRSEEVVTTPLTPESTETETTQDGAQLTPEQVAQDFERSGIPSGADSNAPPQIS